MAGRVHREQCPAPDGPAAGNRDVPCRRGGPDAGELRFGPKGKENATEYVKKYAPDAKLVEDGRTDDSVDLVLGDLAKTVPSAPPTTETVPAGCPSQ